MTTDLNQPTKAQRFDNVEFEFLSTAEKDLPVWRGSVVVRGSSMVLEVTLPGAPSYLILGEARRNFFVGRHDESTGNKLKVVAQWAPLDGVYIGTWIEDGWEFVFKFSLPDEHN